MGTRNLLLSSCSRRASLALSSTRRAIHRRLLLLFRSFVFSCVSFLLTLLLTLNLPTSRTTSKPAAKVAMASSSSSAACNHIVACSAIIASACDHLHASLVVLLDSFSLLSRPVPAFILANLIVFALFRADPSFTHCLFDSPDAHNTISPTFHDYAPAHTFPQARHPLHSLSAPLLQPHASPCVDVEHEDVNDIAANHQDCAVTPPFLAHRSVAHSNAASSAVTNASSLAVTNAPSSALSLHGCLPVQTSQPICITPPPLESPLPAAHPDQHAAATQINLASAPQILIPTQTVQEPRMTKVQPLHRYVKIDRDPSKGRTGTGLSKSKSERLPSCNSQLVMNSTQLRRAESARVSKSQPTPAAAAAAAASAACNPKPMTENPTCSISQRQDESIDSLTDEEANKRFSHFIATRFARMKKESIE